jgi:hypothetical protein
VRPQFFQSLDVNFNTEIPLQVVGLCSWKTPLMGRPMPCGKLGVRGTAVNTNQNQSGLFLH